MAWRAGALRAGHVRAQRRGKACDLYQGFCQRLAHAGFVVLIYDPFSQGERDQYYGSETRSVGRGTRAHNMMGKQLELIGEFFGMWRAWDGIRALDYLLSRPEVDRDARGPDRQLGRRHDDHLAVGDRGPFYDGCAELFCDHLFAQPGERASCRRRAVPAGGAGRRARDGRFYHRRRAQAGALLGQQYDYFDRRGLRRRTRMCGVLRGDGAPEGQTWVCSSGRRDMAIRSTTSRRWSSSFAGTPGCRSSR